MTLLLNTLVLFVLGLILTGLLLYARAGVSKVRLVIGIVWSLILFGLMGYLTTLIHALPMRFLSLMAMSLGLGIIYLHMAPNALPDWSRTSVLDLFLPGLVLMVFGISGFLICHFALSNSGAENSNNLTSLLAAFPAFLLPASWVYSYSQWASIPPLRYTTWTYPLYRELPKLHPVDPIKINLNYTTQPSGLDGPFEGYEVEFPTNVPLGDLFHYFIAFHNRQAKNRRALIQYVQGDMPVEWILYRNAPPAGKRVHLDMVKTLPENGVKYGDTIYASSLVPTLVN